MHIGYFGGCLFATLYSCGLLVPTYAGQLGGIKGGWYAHG